MKTMKTLILALVFALTFLGGGFGVQAGTCPGLDTILHPLAGFEQITVSTTAVALTVPRGSELAVVVVEDADLRYRDDSTDPTASVGTLLKQDASLVVCTKALDRIKFIRDGGTDSLINVNYYGRS